MIYVADEIVNVYHTALLATYAWEHSREPVLLTDMVLRMADAQELMRDELYRGEWHAISADVMRQVRRTVR